MCGADGGWELDPDAQVRERLQYVFASFRRHLVVRRVVRDLKLNGLDLPVRVVSREGYGSLVVAGDRTVSRPGIAIRQQFCFAVLEHCRFFSHLVLRCVRGGDGSLYGMAAPSGAKPRPDSGIKLGTRRVTHACVHPELQNLPAGSTETSLPESEILWVELASRQVRISACEGERP